MILIIKNIGAKFLIGVKIHNMDEMISFSNLYIARRPKYINFHVRR